MKSKLYPCQIPDCKTESAIRSTLKSGEFKGKKVCAFHKYMYERPVQKIVKQIQKQTEKSKQKRHSEREGLTEFFQQAITEMTVSGRIQCEECGVLLNTNLHPINNVAHILCKRVFKSVMTNTNNRLFLCTEKDHPYDNVRSCHSKYDNNVNDRVKMKVFSKALEKYLLFKSSVKEFGNERFVFDNYLNNEEK